MGIAHLDDVTRRERAIGHIRGTWSFLGEAAGSVEVGVRRIELPTGGWSTPAHEHGRAEELFYVLAGRGLLWQDGHAYEVGPGDCIVHLAAGGAHTLHALEPLDVLAFGTRTADEAPRFPRVGLSMVGGRGIESAPGIVEGLPLQFVREAELGPPDLHAPEPRPSTIVNVADVEAREVARRRIARTRRNLGVAAGSISTGLQHVTGVPGMLAAPRHCHSTEEEIFVVLSGGGALLLDDEETPVRAGHVVARPAGTGVAHAFRAGDGGLEYLAYGTRDNADVCFYPDSNKILFGGVKLMARLERLDYWDGED